MHVLKCDRGDADSRATVVQEADVLNMVQSPHVINLYRVLQLGWPSEDSIALDMEYCTGGDCKQAMLSTMEMRACFEQVLAALIYCHAQGARAKTQLNIVLTCRLRN